MSDASPTPRPGTAAFESLLQQVGERCDEASLGWVIWGGLDRPRAERIIEKLTRGQYDQLAAMERRQLAQELAHAFFTRQDGAFQITRELDRTARTERGVVASMTPKELRERLVGHAALRLSRHGARLVWALIRDERGELKPLARELLAGFVQEVKKLEAARSAAREKGAAAEVAALEDSYRKSAERAWDLEAAMSVVEQERAQLLAQVGRHQRQLREEASRTQELASQVQKLREAIDQQRDSGREEGREEVRREAERLEQELAAAERQLAVAKREHNELAALRARVSELEEDNQRLREALQQRREPRPEAARMEDEPTRGNPVVESPKRHKAKHAVGEVRVGVFIDVANLSGAARRLYGGAVDYRQVLALVVGGRKLVSARAYAVDKGKAFDTFARALRQSGFRIAAKKPKRFPDGTMKADWDVGITVDMLTAAGGLDVVVLGSGDGDFVPAVQALKKMGVQVEGVAFDERTANELRQAVDRFFELDAAVLEAGGG